MPDFTGGQFPSLDGEPEQEVAQRTATDTDGNWFRKVFTVHNRNHTQGLGPDHELHLPNFAAVLQDALQRGLHPKSAPELESEEAHPLDPNSTNLTYKVQVVPAVADEDPASTVTPGTLPDALAGIHPAFSPKPATSEELAAKTPDPAPATAPDSTAPAESAPEDSIPAESDPETPAAE